VSPYVPSGELVERASTGETAAIGRLISRAEANMAEARGALAEIYLRAGRSHVIGITGVPGSGKSTLVASLTAKLRRKGSKVGVIAVDPSSPYSGGAILGDRIRMSDLVMDPGVYIRSMATHGSVGGLAHATLSAIDILDFAGFDTIIVETVGVGQDEVEIAKASHTTIVVSAPGLGDEIQAIKAGMLEIADIHVVSKCDRSDANKTLVDIKQMLTLDAATSRLPAWRTPVVGLSSYTGDGYPELVEEIEKHRAFASGVKPSAAREASIASFRLQKTAETLLMDRFATSSARFRKSITERLQKRESDPYSLANELLTLSLG
jgi:LAO/AO transport system kinase